MNEKNNLAGLEGIAEVLNVRGYKITMAEDSILFAIGGNEHPFTGVITMTEKEVIITCQIAKAGDIEEDNSVNFFAACAAINARIRPYAVAMITDSNHPDEDESHEWPIVLTDSLPVGDLSEDELVSSINSLWSALSETSKVLAIGVAR